VREAFVMTEENAVVGEKEGRVIPDWAKEREGKRGDNSLVRAPSRPGETSKKKKKRTASAGRREKKGTGSPLPQEEKNLLR